MSPAITAFTQEIIAPLYDLTRDGGHTTEPDYFELALAEQAQRRRLVFVLGEPGQPVAYVHYNRFPKYAAFRRFNLPEIQDLYVHPAQRRQGFGGLLIAACERQALEDGHQEIGIGVGVVSAFGNAQRLYAKSGYIPDGAGAVFEREPVSAGDLRPLDDRLCLMLIKKLA